MNRIVIDEDKCICCGLGIPEGLQVCPACERRVFDEAKTERNVGSCWCGGQTRAIINHRGSIYTICRTCKTAVCFGQKGVRA
jgi:hypothetical protein